MFIREIEKFAVERISPKAKLYTEEVYTIEEHEVQGVTKNLYKIETFTLNHKNQHKEHYSEYVPESEFYELWDIRNEPDSGYRRVPENEILSRGDWK